MSMEVNVMAADVKCTVTPCTYWSKGNVCSAEAIEVNNNTDVMNSSNDMEIGDIGKSKAGASCETMCKTFKPKG
jgi:hypothetical protein